MAILEGHTLAVKFYEPWATVHEQTYHREALQQFGEKILVRIAWKVEDFENGLVDRCVECQNGATPTIKQRYGALYKDASDSRCSTCFGLGFGEGFRPEVYVTWILAVDDPDDRAHAPTGEMVKVDPTVQFLWDPMVGERDLIVRVDTWTDEVTPNVEEGRYRLDSVERQTLRTGDKQSESHIIVLSQQGRISRLPRDDVYYEVPVI